MEKYLIKAFLREDNQFAGYVTRIGIIENRTWPDLDNYKPYANRFDSKEEAKMYIATHPEPENPYYYRYIKVKE